MKRGASDGTDIAGGFCRAISNPENPATTRHPRNLTILTPYGRT